VISVAPLGPWFFPYLKGFPRKILGVIILPFYFRYFNHIYLFVSPFFPTNWYQSKVLSEYALWLQHSLNFHIRKDLL